MEYSSFFNEEEEITIEDTDLYKLIAKATKNSLREAWRLVANLNDDDIRRRSTSDRSTYLHQIVNITPELYRKYNDVTTVIPLIYRLALRNIRLNAQNEHGNTCLHLACLRPNAHPLCEHLIRIGVDPTIRNKKECRVIHTYKNHQCVMVKGQHKAISGIWAAVQKEDADLVHKLMQTWCRVRVRKNKALKDVAEETANVHILKMLNKYELQNEVACTAYSCDVPRLRELVARGGVDLNMKDYACEVPKPLLIAIAELGEIGKIMIKVLKEYGAKDVSDYENEVHSHQSAFEESKFYKLIDESKEKSIMKALQRITDGKVDTKLISYQEETKGWTYLHFVVDRFIKLKETNEELSRLLIRALYRLALAGIDVNVRDGKGETALIKASTSCDQALMTHLLRIGGDPSLVDNRGRAVSVYVYEDKGKLVFGNNYRVDDLPGLWVAVDNNHIGKAERWCKSWSRINTHRGDRKLLEIARALKRTEIVKLLEEYEHINEFVCAVFASDIAAMKNAIALGNGGMKVNTIDEFFHVGYTWDRHAEYMSRPVIITAMEICTAEVVDFLLKFGADISKVHEEDAPCGPIAFWAFRDFVNNDNALVVASHADMSLRDELGCTLLHRAVQKNRPERKVDIVSVLLDRGVDLAARDWEGSTARDYISIFGVPDGHMLRQCMDDFVLNLVNEEELFKLETLLVDGYDHVLDIKGLRRNRVVCARDIAELKEYKEIIELFDEWEDYRKDIELLHECAKNGDLRTISKMSEEKRCAWGKDKAGRTLLHNAVIYEHPDIVNFLCDQHPNLINSRDSLDRVPLHHCVCLKERDRIWPTLQDAGADPTPIDANNLSVYDYVRELETPTPTREKLRGRRWRDYRPATMLEWEKTQDYGAKAERYELQRHLLDCAKTNSSLADISKMTKDFKGDLSKDNLDIPVLKAFIETKREHIAKLVIETCGARPDAKIEVDGKEMTVLELSDLHDLTELSEFLKSVIKPKQDAAQNTDEQQQQ